MVEHRLPKPVVAGSIPVSRSTNSLRLVSLAVLLARSGLSPESPKTGVQGSAKTVVPSKYELAEKHQVYATLGRAIRRKMQVIAVWEGVALDVSVVLSTSFTMPRCLTLKMKASSCL
jgi:hypothetical protein